MPSYAQLAQESYWVAEFEAPAHAAFNNRMRSHYRHSRSQTGSKGDNRHLDGRHRSRNWILHSRFCTDPNRAYGTRHGRDKGGNGNWLRATDIGIQGAELRAASARLDAAVRAGRLPCVAEWFGTLDGSSVTGWYQGSRSRSDDSHLWHLHVGLWTDSCDNEAQLRLLGDIITGSGGDEPLATDPKEWQTLVGYDGAIPAPDNWGNPKNKDLSLATAVTHLLFRAEAEAARVADDKARDAATAKWQAKVAAAVTAAAADLKVLSGVTANLEALIRAGGGSTEVAALMGRLDALAAIISAGDQQVIAALRADITRLRTALSDAEQAASDTLDTAPPAAGPT
jgi:hypothetical protein